MGAKLFEKIRTLASLTRSVIIHRSSIEYYE